MGTCYKCKKKVSPDFNVCPYCGVDLSLEDELIEIENIPKKGVTIEFNYSASQSFEFAVKSAGSFDTFRKFGEDKKATYRVTVEQSKLASLNELLENLKGWRSR